MIELDLHDLRDLVLERRVGRHDLERPRKELTRRSPENRFRKALLGAEVVVQQRLVDAGLFGDVLHARARRAMPDEHGVRGVEDPALGVAVVLCSPGLVPRGERAPCRRSPGG